MKHARKRDVTHGSTARRRQNEFAAREAATTERLTIEGRKRHARVAKEDGTSFPAHGAGALREPRRPAIFILMPDFGDPDGPPGVFGMYPAAFIPKILPWLKCERSRILHVCSGGLPPGEGVRVDIRAEAKPDIVADGRCMPLEEASVDAVLIDPPYSEHYARELYGTDYPRPSHLLREAARVVRHGGRIGIVHYIVPNAPDSCVFVKSFGLSMGFGYPMRAVSFYERRAATLFGDAPAKPGRKRRPS